MRNYCKVVLLNFVFLFLCLFINNALAYPFSVTVKAGTTLPVFVINGTSAIAYYTVQNQTNTIRTDNFVKYLPPNVTQVVSNVTFNNPCDTNFSLTPKGTPGDSCTLQLKITGAVNAKDPNPRQHLFVCFPGGKTCAGTPNPLNVRVTPAPPPNVRLVSITVLPSNQVLQTGGTQQYQAQGLYSDNTVLDITNLVFWQSSTPSVATITSTGLATAITAGPTTISASLSGITGSTSLNVKTLIAYVSDMENDAIYYCPVDPVTGLISGCTLNPNLVGKLNEPQGIAVNNEGTMAYIVNCDPSAFAILACQISPGNGELNNCVSTYSSSTDGLVGIALNPAGTTAYITSQSDNSVIVCAVQPGSGLLSCNPPFTSPFFNQPQGVSLNTLGTRIYVMNRSSGSANPPTPPAVCSVNLGDGTLFDCASTGGNLFNADGVAIDFSSNFAYIANQIDNFFYICPITTTGDFGSCNSFGGFSFPIGVAQDFEGIFTYVTNFTSGVISRCIVNPPGSVSCIPSGGVVPSAAYIALGLVG